MRLLVMLEVVDDEGDSDITAPTTPTNLTATAVSTSQINLSWTASTDDVSAQGALIYKVRRDDVVVHTTAAGAVTYADTGLDSGTEYEYTVSAVDEALNESAESTPDAATTDPVYEDVILADGPVGYWKLDEPSGTTAADSSPNGNDGTYNGTPSLASRALNGVLGSVADFDGMNNWVSLPALGADAWTEITLEFWTILDVLSTSKVFLGENFEGASNHVKAAVGYGGDVGSGDTNIRGGRFDGGWGTVTPGSSLSTDTLHHVVLTMDASNNTILYIDGTSVASTSSFGYTTGGSETSWGVGKRPDTSAYIDAAIGHVAIYDAELSPTQVATHYDTGSS